VWLLEKSKQEAATKTTMKTSVKALVWMATTMPLSIHLARAIKPLAKIKRRRIGGSVKKIYAATPIRKKFISLLEV
jgi:hypothetical protein